MDLASDENVRSSQIYLPFKAGFPNLREYVKDIFRRREFISELSRVESASDNLNTLFGSIWGLINPLLSAVTYFLFIFILQIIYSKLSDFFFHIAELCMLTLSPVRTDMHAHGHHLPD